jgi:hypothetical protein
MAKAIGWWCKSRDLAVASTRIRGAIVLRALRDRGVDADWFDPRFADRFRTLVLSKRYDDATLEVARRFQANGGRVVLDLCDNNFAAASAGAEHQRRVANLRSLVGLADAITVSAPPLVELVARECPGSPGARVIGDMPDDAGIVPLAGFRRLAIAVKRHREKAAIERLPPGVTRLVWFGNAEGRLGQSGMVDLSRIVPDLARVAHAHPIHLTVISNSRRRYEEYLQGAAFPRRYIEWDPWTVEPILALQHIALIPATANEFTSCKSDNRAVSAFRAGLAVVADPVPSYAHVGDAIATGDFAANIIRYILDPARRAADASAGKAHAAASSDPGMLSERWLEACGRS